MSNGQRTDDATATRRPRALRSKWTLLGAFWIAQAVIVYLVGTLWLILMASSSAASVWARLTSFEEIISGLTDRGLVIVMGVYILGVTALQLLLVLPVRKPVVAPQRSASLWGSIAVAGLAIAAVWTGGVLAVVSLVYLARTGDATWLGSVEDSIGGGDWVLFMPLLIGWAVATPLLAAFCRRGRRETALARISTRILQGTAIEVVAVIPLAVMVRRRTDCFCDTGTFWALTLCGTVGVVLGGPAVLYTILSKRRRRWYAGRCEVCGYDMTGLRSADRCPECGCGWAAPTGPKTGAGGAGGSGTASPPPADAAP